MSDMNVGEPISKEQYQSIARLYLSHAEEFIRFSVSQRMEHLVQIVAFVALVATGVPQKFHDAGWANWMMTGFGGIDMTRSIHHFFAAVMVIECVYHFGAVLHGLNKKRTWPAMLPAPKDIVDAIGTLKYFMGLAKEEPKFDRFDYRQKLEYWSLVWGTVVMVLTGMVLLFPAQVTAWIPGDWVPAAKAAHGGEALLAFLSILVWHMYWAHFRPGSFPFDKSIFTGKISKERMIEEHPLEYERLVQDQEDEEAVLRTLGR